MGCADVQSAWTWKQAQDRIGQLGRLPSSEEAPMKPMQHAELCDTVKFETLHVRHSSADSLEWFGKHIQVYVVNLDRDTTRLQQISHRLFELGISFQRIRGVDLTDGKTTLAGLKKEGVLPHYYDYKFASKVAESPEQNVGGILGTVGCASAHFRTYEAIIAQDKPMAIVVEDDTHPADDFVQRIRALVENELPCSWEVLALTTRCPFGSCVSPHLNRVMPDLNEPEFVCRHGTSFGFYGMLYRRETLRRVSNIMKKRVWNASAPWCLDIDMALSASSGEVEYYAVPGSQKPRIIEEVWTFGSSRMVGNGEMPFPLPRLDYMLPVGIVGCCCFGLCFTGKKICKGGGGRRRAESLDPRDRDEAYDSELMRYGDDSRGSDSPSGPLE